MYLIRKPREKRIFQNNKNKIIALCLNIIVVEGEIE
jgi:hypothetical protein